MTHGPESRVYMVSARFENVLEMDCRVIMVNTSSRVSGSFGLEASECEAIWGVGQVQIRMRVQAVWLRR